MSQFFLEFQANSLFSGGNAPVLEILIGGSVISSVSMNSGNSAYRLGLDFTGNFPSSLTFRFDSGSGDPGDSITFSDVTINGQSLDLGSYLTNVLLNQGETSVVDTPAIEYLFGQVAPTDASLGTPTITGTAGDDAFISGTPGDDVIDAQGGNDLVVGFDGADGVLGGAGDDQIFTLGGDDIVLGGAGNDMIIGGEGADELYGQGDNDTLVGEGGDDVLNGGAGDDGVFGDAGNDTLFGGTGADTLGGGADDDVLHGEDGNDILIGNDGDDGLFGGNNDDQLFGDAGSDWLDGGSGADLLDGGIGADDLYGGSGDDEIFGGDGADIIHAGGDDDYVTGGANNDTINGDAGRDVIIGGSGADTIDGGTGNDILHGHGLDAAAISDILFNNPDVVYSQETGSFYQYVATAVTDVNAIANANSATLNGVNGHLVNITSAAENDFVQNIANAEIWIGGSDAVFEGQWTWDNGQEAGAVFYQGNVGGITVGSFYTNFANNEPNDYQTGEDYLTLRPSGEWNDFGGPEFSTGTRAYVIEWDAGVFSDDNAVDTVDGGDGNDQIYGHGGDDILNGQNNDDILYGGDGNDIIDGEAGIDVLYGQEGNDTLDGGTGNDVLNGGNGGDILIGGLGDDILIGSTFTSATTVFLDESFDVNLSGFVYSDGGFGGSDPTGTNYARGAFLGTDGNNANGSANLILGGINNNDIANISGNFSQTFTVGAATTNASLSFSYRVEHTALGAGTDDFDAGENLELYVEVDGTQIDGGSGDGFFAEFLAPDRDFDTGWINVTLDLGSLSAGTHTIDLGGLLTLKTFEPEEIAVRFDDIIISETVVSGDASSDILSGGIGNDTLNGGLGVDTLYGVDAADSATSSANSGAITLLSSDFDTNLDGFSYSDGGFGGSDPTGTNYARGAFLGTDGNGANGSAEIILGGVNNNDINDISGTFSQSFIVSTAATNSTLTFSYRVEHTALGTGTDDFDAGEDLEIYAALDGVELDNGTGDGFFVEYLAPDRDFDTGWITVSFDTGALGVGAHTLDLGGLLTRKTFEPEELSIRFDDVLVSTQQSVTSTGTTNLINGGGGADLLFGSTESDTFIFDALTAFDGIDQITNFNVTEGDALDISDVLDGFVSGTSAIEDFIQLSNSGSDTVVSIDTNGSVGGANFVAVAEILGLNDMSATALFNDGSIIV